MKVHIPLPDGAGILIAAILIPGLVAYWLWYFPRSKSLLEHWATRNGYKIIDSSFRWFSKGPFFLMCSRGQTVYRIKVSDHRGNERTGWVRCGGSIGGLFIDEATVVWDNQASW
jgi:hypothetical protein